MEHQYCGFDDCLECYPASIQLDVTTMSDDLPSYLSTVPRLFTDYVHRNRTASGELPIATPEVRKVLSGSIEGATRPEVVAKAAELNPSRVLLRAQCVRCGYRWQAPKIGSCPKCSAGRPVILDLDVCMALRV
jgi:hypothetical protein